MKPKNHMPGLTKDESVLFLLIAKAPPEYTGSELYDFVTDIADKMMPNSPMYSLAEFEACLDKFSKKGYLPYESVILMKTEIPTKH